MLGQAERLYELKHLFNKADHGDNACKIIAFTSGKGGTGKTFLSLNIAYELAKRSTRVLYVDLDFNMANAHLMLNINPVNTISALLNNNALLGDIVYRYNENFHIIFGDSGKINFPDIRGTHISHFFSQVKNAGYDVVILDFPAGAGRLSLDMLSYVDYSVIVASTEPTAVMDAYALSKLMKCEKLACEQYIIINKSRNFEDGETAFKNLNSAVKHFLKTSLNLLGIINYRSEASEAVYAQKLAAELFENSIITAEISSCAAEISEITQLANIHQPL